MFGLETGLEGLEPDDLPPLIDVFDQTGRRVAASEYPLMRTLRGEVVTHEDVLVGPTGGPWREIVVHGSQIVASDGTVLGAVAALTDVSAERAARRALDEERRKLAEAQELGQRPDKAAGVRVDRVGVRDGRHGVYLRVPGGRVGEGA